MANNNHFNLTLDTQAPSGSITLAQYSNNANIGVDYSISDQSEALKAAKYIKVWLVKTETLTTVPASPAFVAVTQATGTITITVTDEGVYEAHAVVMDDVGNESDITGTTPKQIVYDKSAPVLGTITIVDPERVPGQPEDETNSYKNLLTIACTDKPDGDNSGVKEFIVSCSAFDSTYTLPSEAGGSYSDYVFFKADTHEGTKTITVVAKDFAGNESEAKTVSIYFDPDAKNTNLVLYSDSDYSSAIAASPDFTNKTNFYAGVNVTINPGQYDIVKFKIWGTSTQSTEPSTWTDITDDMGKGTAKLKLGNYSFTSGEGAKTVSVALMDDVGNTETRTYSVIIDTTKPTNIISSSERSISTSGTKKTSVLTYTVADANSNPASATSGIASWKVYCNAEANVIASGTAAVSGATTTISATSTGMAAGENTFTITATDKAGNTSVVATTQVYLDNSAPTLTVTKPTANSWYTANNSGLSNNWEVTFSNVSKSCTASFWVNTSATDTTAPDNAVDLTTASTTVSLSNVKDGNPPTERTGNYLHIKLTDGVGNTTYYHVPFNYDATAPTKPTVTFSKAVYGSTAANITVSGTSDATSGLDQFMIENVAGKAGLASGTNTWISYLSASNYAVTLTTAEGMHYITVKVMDKAGNVSVISDEASTELDTTDPTGSIVLRVKGTNTPKPDPSNIADVDLYITIADDAITTQGEGYYKVWGDFVGGSTTEPDEWVKFATGGSTNITLSKTCTSGDGDKNFYVKLKDNAGNVSPQYSAKFYYDTAAPIVRATSDYNVISKIHTERMSDATTKITGKYCDYIRITADIVTTEGGSTTSGERYKAYKAVAYVDQEAASKGNASNTAIPGTSWSDETGRTGTITIDVSGENYEKALNGGTTPTAHAMDGAHIITVYVQDMAGTWSEKAIFA